MIFPEFPKIPRLSREIIVTEKIDGTNGLIFIGEDGEFLAGSRTRWITPEQDNHGFARWAQEHKAELLQLGPGHHYGEWWGSGIQRGYGLPKGEKRFSLFNTGRWLDHSISLTEPPIAAPFYPPACCKVVPVLYRGEFNTAGIEAIITLLGARGSVAAPGFMNPEGVVIFHTGGNLYFKKTLLKDEKPKTQ